MKYFATLIRNIINVGVDAGIIYLMFHYGVINTNGSVWSTMFTVAAALFVFACIDYVTASILSRNYGEPSDAELYKKLIDTYKSKQENWWSDRLDREDDDPNEDDVK